jgi:ElaB/YqjD/DUF883 family membrane-anchored ribosome-binding protein
VAFAGVLAVSKGALNAFAEAEAKTAVSTKILENSVAGLTGTQLKALEVQAGAGGTAMDALKKAMDSAGKSAVQMAFDDEEASNSFAKLFQATGNVADANKLLSGSMDLARRKGIDLESATKMMGLAYAGNEKMLKELNVEVAKGTSGMEIAGIVMKSNAGIAEEYANTTAGAMERAKIQSDNLNESIGGALAPAFAKVRDALQPVITAFADFVEKHPQLTAGVIIVVGGLLGLVTVIGTLTIAFSALNLAMLPYIAIIAGIALAIGAGIYVYRNWGEIMEWLGRVFGEVWDGIKITIQEWWTVVTTTMQSVWSSVQSVLKSIGDAFKLAWETIKQITVAVFNFIKDYFTIWGLGMRLLTSDNMLAVYNAIVEAWTKVKTFFTDVWASIKGIFSGAIDYINGLIDSFINKVNSMISALSRVGSNIGSSINNAVSSVSASFKRASGGSVMANTPYIVGENGQEMFIPSTSGTILNAGQLAGVGGGITINVTGNSFMGQEGVAEALGDQLVKILRLNTKL